MSKGWAEVVILISVIGQFFCGMACVTSCSRTFFAFSRDRVTPGQEAVEQASAARGVPAAAVHRHRCALAGIMAAARRCRATRAGVPPVALFAVVSIGVIGLYIAYVTPVYLRWRAGDSFQQGAWNLGNRWRWINPDRGRLRHAHVDLLLPPVLRHGRPCGRRDFDWNAANFTPLVVGVVGLGIWLAWVLAA